MKFAPAATSGHQRANSCHAPLVPAAIKPSAMSSCKPKNRAEREISINQGAAGLVIDFFL